jgi:hypothetical protein
VNLAHVSLGCSMLWFNSQELLLEFCMKG